jgi:HSP20 family molecular chaperone IbpA
MYKFDLNSTFFDYPINWGKPFREKEKQNSFEKLFDVMEKKLKNHTEVFSDSGELKTVFIEMAGYKNVTVDETQLDDYKINKKLVVKAESSDVGYEKLSKVFEYSFSIPQNSMVKNIEFLNGLLVIKFSTVKADVKSKRIFG